MGPECDNCPVLKSPFLKALSDRQAERLHCIFRLAHYRRNQILFFEGGTAQHIFALRTGLVKQVKSLDSGKDRIVRIVFPGELLGLEALTADTYSLTTVALRDCEMCATAKESFLGLLREDPELALGVVRLLAHEVAKVRSHFTSLSFKDARRRVAGLLLSLIKPDAAPAPQATFSLNLPFSRQEISEILELSPETVSRTLSLFAREQLIETRGRRLIIKNLPALEAAGRG